MHDPFLMMYITKSSITNIKKTLKTTFPKVGLGSVMVPLEKYKE